MVKGVVRNSTLALAGLTLLALTAAAPKPMPTPTPAPTPALTPSLTIAPRNTCATCKERSATLDPAKVAKGAEPGVQEGYEIARKYPATLDKLHCYCECAESPMFHHKTLLTCFTNTHAAGCGICLSEARLAGQLKDKGLPDEQIKTTVESVHRTDGHPPTN